MRNILMWTLHPDPSPDFTVIYRAQKDDLKAKFKIDMEIMEDMLAETGGEMITYKDLYEETAKEVENYKNFFQAERDEVKKVSTCFMNSFRRLIHIDRKQCISIVRIGYGRPLQANCERQQFDQGSARFNHINQQTIILACSFIVLELFPDPVVENGPTSITLLLHWMKNINIILLLATFRDASTDISIISIKQGIEEKRLSS